MKTSRKTLRNTALVVLVWGGLGWIATGSLFAGAGCALGLAVGLALFYWVMSAEGE